MYMKDMPSAALGCIDSSADRVALDLALDAVADDRIEAAYAIVELGERGSKKGVEFPSTEEEDLDVEESEQYHQVPRSPDCLRQDRRSSESPTGTPTMLIDCRPPKFVHVKGAVMPSRTSGKPVQKLQSAKRRHEEEHATSGGIKAKLARMLIEKKSSLEEAGKPDLDDATGQRTGEVDSDEEQHTRYNGGRFVRTCKPFPERMTATREQFVVPENLEVNLERSFSAEEINKFRESLWNKRVSEHDGDFPKSGISTYDVIAPGYSRTSSADDILSFKTSQLFSRELPAASDSQMFTPRASTGEFVTPVELLKFPFQASRRELVSSENVFNSCRDSSVGETARLPHDVRMFSGHSGVNSGLVSSWPGHLLLLGSTGQGVHVPNTGLLHYLPLPESKSSTSSVCLESPVSRADVKLEARNDSDALRYLERLSLGRGRYEEPTTCADLSHHDMQKSSRNTASLAGRFCPQFGSLTSISNYYSVANSPVSEAGYSSSELPEAKSLQDLAKSMWDSPRLASFYDNGQFLQSPKRDFRISNHERPLSSSSHRCYATQHQTKTKSRRKTSPTAEALEMVKGGEFGSLKTIRNLYNSMRSRKLHQKMEIKGLMAGDVVNGLDQLSPNLRVQNEQECPLDLSRCRRRRGENKDEVKYVPLDPQFCQPAWAHVDSEKVFATRGCFEFKSECRTDDVVPRFTNSDNLLSQEKKVKVFNSVIASSDGAAATAAVTADRSESCCDDNDLAISQSRSRPSSQLPLKKRKLRRQSSENCDFSESKTSSKFTDVQVPPVNITRAGSPDNCKNVSSPSAPVDKTDVRHTNVITESKLRQAVMKEDSSLFSAVAVRDEDGDLPLHIAVAQGSLDIVKKLLPMMSQAGISIDSCNNRRQTALHLAVISNQPQMVETLLSASSSANACDRKGDTAIHLAVKYKAPACLQQILFNSRIPLDLDSRNYEGLTSLHIGVQLLQKDAVRALLTHGANANAMDGTNGRTPLFYAVENNDYVMASMLLKNGSDPCIASYSGCTPLQIATARSFRDMTSILERSSLRGIQVAASQAESFHLQT